MINYSLIGKKIRNERISHNLTQTEFAKELGVSTGYVCQVECGDKCFNLNRLEELANLFGKPVTYFLEGAAGDIRLSVITEIVEMLSRMSKDSLDKTKEILNIIAK